MEEKLVFTGDAKQLEAEYAKLDKAATNQGNKLEWIANQAQRMGQEFGKSSTDAVKALDQAAKEAGKVELAHRKAAQAARELAGADLIRAAQLKDFHTREADAAAKRQLDLKREANSIRETAQAQREAGRTVVDQTSTTEQLAGTAARYLATWLTISRVASEVKSHMQDIDNMRMASLDANLSQAQADAMLVRNLPLAGLSPQQADAAVGSARSRIDAINQASKFGATKELTLGAAHTLSAAGGNVEKAFEILGVTAPLGRGNPEALKITAAGIADMQRLAPHLSPKQLAGGLLQIGQQSRVVDEQKLFENAPSAISAGVAFSKPGTTDQAIKETAAMFSAFGAAAVDPNGEETRTFINKYNESLRDFFTKPRDVKVGSKNFKVPPPADPGTPGSRQEFLVRNPRLHKDFLADVELGRGRFRPHVENMLKGQGPYAEYHKFLSELDFEGGTSTYDTYVRNLSSSTPALKALQGDAGRQASTDKQVLSNNLANRWAAAQKDLADVRSQTSDSVSFINRADEGVTDFVARMTYDSPEAYHKQMLENRLDAIRRWRQLGISRNSESFRESLRDESMVKERLNRLSGSEGGNLDVVKTLQETNRLLSEQLKAIQGSARTPGLAPAANADRGRNRE